MENWYFSGTSTYYTPSYVPSYTLHPHNNLARWALTLFEASKEEMKGGENIFLKDLLKVNKNSDDDDCCQLEILSTVTDGVILFFESQVFESTGLQLALKLVT